MLYHLNVNYCREYLCVFTIHLRFGFNTKLSNIKKLYFMICAAIGDRLVTQLTITTV